MNRVQVFTWLAFAIALLAYIPYIKGILSSQTRPTISTWLSWFIMDFAILAGMLMKGEMVYQMWGYTAGSVIVILICLKKHPTLGWKPIDSISMGLVLTAVVAWFLSDEPNVLIGISLSAMMIGSIPMFVNLWKDPKCESLGAWLACLVGGTCGVLAIPKFTFAFAAAPITFFVFQLSVLALIARRYRRT